MSIIKEIIKLLRTLGKIGATYPKPLQDARRKTFKKQIDKHNKGA
jgi:hypothetical protein